MNRFQVGPGFLVAAAFIGPGTIVTASRAGGRVRDNLALGGLVLGGRYRHPAGHGGASGSRRPARARRGHTRQPREPADPGGSARPHSVDHPGRERRLPDRQPARGVARYQPADRATAGASGGDHRGAGRRPADDRNLQGDPERTGRPRGSDERGFLPDRHAHRAEPGRAFFPGSCSRGCRRERCSPCWR